MTQTNRTIRVLASVALALLTSLLVFVVGYAGNVQSATRPAKADREDAVQHFPRDVYVIVGSSLRNPTNETSPDEPLFNVAGVSLDLTWGQWTGASATSKARLVKKSGKLYTYVEVEMSGLVPDGVYSIFYGTLEPDSEHPLCQNVERTLPLVSRDRHQSPDASSFVADASGEAVFSGRIKGRVLKARQVFYFVNYHFDGGTYHPFPNRGEFLTQNPNCRSSFGEDAMRQLLVFQKFE
jgi:hypothetical protein